MTQIISKLVRPDSVHASVYVDPELFQLELQRIFASTWNYVGHQSQIPNPGDFLTTEIAQQGVVLVRQDDLSISVLRNRCAHRGALVMQEKSGHANLLRCCYHGWTYRKNGQLHSVPLEQGYTPSCVGDPAFAMESLVTKDYRGFVFASLNNDPPILQNFLGGATTALDNMVDRSPTGKLLIEGSSFRYLIPSNWKIFLENLHDGVHPPTVHPSSIAASRQMLRTRQNKMQATPMALDIVAANGQSHEQMAKLQVRCYANGHSDMRGFRKALSNGDTAKTYQQLLEKRHGVEKTKDVLETNIHNLSIYPNLSAHPSFMQIRVMFPLSVDRTLIEIWTLKPVGAPDEIHRSNVVFSNTVHSPASVVKVDDVETYHRVQQGLMSSNRWVSQHRELVSDESTAVSEQYIRNQFQAWLGYMSGDK